MIGCVPYLSPLKKSLLSISVKKRHNEGLQSNIVLHPNPLIASGALKTSMIMKMPSGLIVIHC